MAELSSLLFVDTDELGRPTGLIASEDTDTLASALLPQDVKDTVEIVKVADVSGNYPGWNTVSGVSGLAPVSSELLALPGDFDNLEASVAYVSTVVDSIDPTAINGVSSTVLNFSGNWQSTYTYTLNASDNIADTSNAVIGVDSGLSALAVSSAELSTAIDNIPVGGQVPADVSNNWQSTYGFTSGASGIIEDGSGVLSGLSGSIAGTTDGPDVLVFSALSAIADRIRIVDDATRVDDLTGQTVLLSGASKITTKAGTMSITPGSERKAFLKLQNSLGGQAYLSATSGAGLIVNGADPNADIWMAREALGAATVTSSLLGLYKTNDDNSGGWQDSYTYVDSASGNIGNVSSYVFNASDNLADTSTIVSDGSSTLSALSGNDEALGTPKAWGLSSLQRRLSFVDANGAVVSNPGNQTGLGLRLSGGTTFTTNANTVTVKSGNDPSASIFATKTGIFLSALDKVDLLSTEINYGAFGSTSSLIPIIADLASVSGTGGGGGGGLSSIASAILVSDGSAVDINIGGTPENNTILVLDTENEQFNYQRVAFQVIGDTILPLTESLGFDFGGGTARNFVTSGSTKTLLEFDDKSRVALGRSSVPLEISALGQSDIRLEDDGTNGAFVYVKGADAAPSLIHLANVDLSADADSQIDIDTDINLGAAAHLNGNTLGAIHIACKNTQGTSVSGGTPVYITGNVGGSNKIEIGIASASVASSMPAVGVLSEDLANNAEGYVDAFGIASKLNTSSFVSGDTLYVAPSGGLTDVRPTATTDLVQNIGIVELSDATNGKIIVLGPGRTNDVPTSVNNEVTFASAITINNTLTANGGTGSTHPTAGGQVLQSRGSSSVTWGNKKKLRWYESDFHVADVRVNGPWLGGGINSGSTGAAPTPVSLYTEMMGAVLLRSSSTPDSGYRWDTQASDRIAPRVNLFYECIFAIPDDFTNKTVKLGFYDNTSDATGATDGTYFLIDNSGNMTPETSNNSTQTTGTSYTLSVDTVYKAQIWWNTSTSVVFKITNMDESTTHASETISTNLPSGTARRFGAGIVAKSSGSSTDDLLVLDYMGWGLYPYREDDSV